MRITKTDIEGLIIFEPVVLEDNRGYFFESYNEKVFAEAGVPNRFVQDNHSYSRYGVIRGLHYQLPPYAQSKLVRVLDGRILDVAVDIRKGSPTFGKSFTLELSGDNKIQLFIPAGFAHGFSVLSDSASVVYKCDNFYNKASEGGIIYNDADLAIDWQIGKGREEISGKDKQLPSFRDCINTFAYGK